MEQIKDYVKCYWRLITFWVLSICLAAFVTDEMEYHPVFRANFWRYFGVSVMPLLGLALMSMGLWLAWRRSHALALALGVLCGCVLALSAVKLTAQFTAQALIVFGLGLVAFLCFHGTIHANFLPRPLERRWTDYLEKVRARREKEPEEALAPHRPYTDYLDELGFRPAA